MSLVLCSTYIIPRDQDKFVFYVNNDIDWDQFNQLYDFDWMKKGIKSAYTIVCKLWPALTRANNYRLEVVKKERWKKEEIIEKLKTKIMAAKCQRAKGRIRLSNKEKGNYKNNTRDKIDLDQANYKYLLKFEKGIGKKLQAASKVVYIRKKNFLDQYDQSRLDPSIL